MPFRLLANCRNTVPIHRAGYAFYKGDAIDDPDLKGDAVSRVVVDDEARQVEAIAEVVRELLAAAVAPEEIAVLLAKRPKDRLYGLLQAKRLPGGVSWAVEASGVRRAVQVDTVGRFKGLEAAVVVLWVGEELVDEGQLTSVSIDMSPAFIKGVSDELPNAQITFDKFHVVGQP